MVSLEHLLQAMPHFAEILGGKYFCVHLFLSMLINLETQFDPRKKKPSVYPMNISLSLELMAVELVEGV